MPTPSTACSPSAVSRRRATASSSSATSSTAGPQSLAVLEAAVRPRRRRRLPARQPRPAPAGGRARRAARLHSTAIRSTQCSPSPAARPLDRLAAPRAGWRAFEAGWLCVHAGIVPQWDAAATLACAAEGRGGACAGPASATSCARMPGNAPARWDDSLAGSDRLRVIVNALTRMRFCSADGTLELKAKAQRRPRAGGPVPVVRRARPARRRRAGRVRPLEHARPRRPPPTCSLALDTGCVWGGALTAVRVDGGRRDVFQVACAQAQAPGGDG